MIFQITLGSQPSYAWRRVLAGRDLFREGMVWSIGDGKSVSIWEDKWIFRPSMFSIQSPCRTFLADAKVEVLLDVNPIRWKTSLIWNTFSPDEAEIICNIHLGHYQQNDI
jgi:hypothetical protein